MLLRIFNSRNTFLQIFIVVVYAIIMFLMPVKLVENNGFNPLYEAFVNAINDNAVFIRISFIIIVAATLILTQFYSIYFGLFKRQHYHFLFIAPLLIFSYPQAFTVSPVLLSLPLVILGVQQLFRIAMRDTVANEELAFSAITFSIASLFYSVLIWDILLLVLALILFRRLNIREIILVLSSYLVPYIYLFTFYFLQDKFQEKWNLFISSLINFSWQLNWENNYVNNIFFALVAIFSILISLSIIGNLRSKLIQIRVYTSFLFWGLVFSTLLIFLAGFNTQYHYAFVLFIVSILAGLLFSELKNNWIFETFIFIFLLHNFYVFYLIFNA